jgi:hypothetical protein
LSRRAIAAATDAKASIQAGQLEGELALRTAILGRCDDARNDAKASIRSTTDLDMRGSMALVLALRGDLIGARKLIDRLKREFPDSTEVRYVYIPETEAALALDHGDPQKAIANLSAASPYNLAYPFLGVPIYRRGLAHLAAHQATEAAAQFQMMIDHVGVIQNRPQGALAHLGLAEPTR